MKYIFHRTSFAFLLYSINNRDLLPPGLKDSLTLRYVIQLNSRSLVPPGINTEVKINFPFKSFIRFYRTELVDRQESGSARRIRVLLINMQESGLAYRSRVLLVGFGSYL